MERSELQKERCRFGESELDGVNVVSSGGSKQINACVSS